MPNKFTFRATGQTVKFPGFLAALGDGAVGEKILPAVKKSDPVSAKKIAGEQHFTKPPARFTEASLIKELEARGIGRPSTYAPTIDTIEARGYTEKDGKSLRPTDIAEVVTDFLAAHFSREVEYEFTAKIEETFDEIASGRREWHEVVADWYRDFEKNLVEKDKTVTREAAAGAEGETQKCPECGGKMTVKLSRFGKKFWACGEENCGKTAPYGDEAKLLEKLRAENAGEICEKCGKKMEVKIGRFGPFLACSGYPDCKNLRPLAAEAAKRDAEIAKIREAVGGDILHPETGEKMEIKTGRFGPYASLDGLNVPIRTRKDGTVVCDPEAALAREKRRAELTEKYADEKCAECGAPMKVNFSRFGAFLACSKKTKAHPRKNIPRDDAKK